MSGPIEVLRHNRRQIVQGAESIGQKKLRGLLAKAQASLNRRLREAEGLGGPGKDSFTAAQLRATLAQLEQVLADLRRPLAEVAQAGALDAADPAVAGTVEYLRAAERKFAGVGERLPLNDALLFDRARSGVESSVLHRLQGDPVRGPGILKRYGDAVVQKFEGHLQQRLLARTPWQDVRNGLIADSPFLQQAPAFWAERIVRTEAMNGSNRAIWEANRAADEQLGDVVKILSATFDDRTGADSVAVHGQIRRPSEPFQWWDGLYQHPPNRPNDREVVVTHRLSWPLSSELLWRTDAEVAARWAANGRKGAPPPRPKMTTVEVSKFGKEQPPAKPATPIEEPPAIPPRPARGPVASPFFDEDLAPYKSPEPEPEVLPLPEPEPARVDFLARREGAQAGSNPGGYFRGSDGVLRYVKFYKDPVQAELERLANNIYRDLGLGVPKSEVFDHEGRAAHASEVVAGDSLGSRGVKKADAKKVLKGFAADVLVGNWDAVGLNHDNVLMSGGKAYRIDQGGALLHRAQGGLKPQAALGKIDEWDKFFDPGVNPAYAKVAKAAGVARAEDVPGLKSQLEAIRKLKQAHGSWGKYVDHAAPGLPDDVRKQVVGMLSERARLLDDKLLALKKAKLPAPAVVRKFEDLPPGPMPAHKEVPAGHASHAVYQDEVRRRLDEIVRKDMRRFEQEPGRVEQEASLRNAINDYTAGGYGDIRNAGKLGESEWIKKHGYAGDPATGALRYRHYRQKYEALDRAFDEGPPVGPGSEVKEAFRGLGSLSRDVFDRIIGAEQFEADSVTSTAWDPKVAENFMAGSSRNYSVMLHFRPKPGSRNWLPIETHSSQGDYEREILLRKGTRFRVISVRKSRSRVNAAVLELEEI